MKITLIEKSGNPEKNLINILKKHSGRDSAGHVSVRHQGGRQKRYYRQVDFRREATERKGKVINIEYDPNRSAHIALVEYEKGSRSYVLLPEGIKLGDHVMSSPKADITAGNTLPLSEMPLGTEIHNIELYPGRGGQAVRSAGSFAVVVAKDKEYADVRMPSKEIRKIPIKCKATVGRVGYGEHKLEKIGKAGRNRLMGIRPSVRGTAQNPRSHPHGGGEGRSGESMPPKTSQGKAAHGKRTRHPKKWSKKLIVKRRK